MTKAILIGYVWFFGAVTLFEDVDFRTPEKAAPKDQAIELNVFPSAIELTSKSDFQSVIAQLKYPDGRTEDVTNQLSYRFGDPSVAVVNENRISPLGDGATELSVSASGFEATLPVSVSKASLDAEISFKNDVLPIFSKTGCNAGSCHGAARGKDGFRLSLYGFDPSGDHFRLTREIPSRRIDLSLPDECLLLSKATGDVSHTGGALIKPESDFYKTILKWIKQGAVNDTAQAASVESIVLSPPDGLLHGPGSRQQMSVTARYSDGTDRDVSALATFLSNNDNTATVDANGVVIAQNRGEAFITARFDTHTVGSSFIVVPQDHDFQWQAHLESNYIDALVNQKLRKLRIQPSEICSDQEFIRRVSIDICGVVPSSDEVLRFVADKNSNKRQQLVDELIERKEFVEIWVMKWSELLQIRSLNNLVSYKAALLYYTWLQKQIAGEVPVDQMVRELLSSEGGTFTAPATNYYQNEQDQLKIAENVAQVFMGIRIQCAQCHNHPFDRWTMDDYYGFAAFFSQLGRKPSEDPREVVVFNRSRGQTKHPVTNQNVRPKFLGGELPDVKGKDRRAVLAQWLTAPENPYFSKNLANIIWAHFFGKGIVHEVDDVRISNPPVNEALLNELGRRLVDGKFNFKQLVRDICCSQTYQRSSQANPSNENDQTNFSHASLRRIRAEVLLDVISQITETKNKFRGLPLGARAVQIADGNTSTYFLTTFGRAKRETVCSCEVKTEPNLSQALHFLNGATINKKIKQGRLIERWIESGESDQQIVTEIYLRCLARRPSESELSLLLGEISANKDRSAALEDLFWAVLNSREFIFNH